MNDNVILDSSLSTTHNLNVISSTKINQKVTQILRIFGVLPPVSSAQKKSTEDDPTTSKAAHDKDVPGEGCTVVAIRAKANVASKLISIVEILKRDLAKRATESRDELAAGADKAPTSDARSSKAPIPRIYQYTSVTTIPAEVKIKAPQPKPTQPASTAPPAPEDPQQQGTKRKRPVDSSQDSITTATATTRTTKKQKQDDSLEGEPDITVPDEDDAEEFEMMAQAKVTAPGSAGKDVGKEVIATDAPVTTQMRDVPLLTVYLCSAPVAVLEKAFGEQAG